MVPKPTIKEQIITQAIAEAQERIKFLEHELFHNDPVHKQFELYKKFNEFLKNKKGGERCTPESMKYIDNIGKEMKAQKKRQESYDSQEISDELADIKVQLSELVNEQFYLIKRKR